MWPFNFLKKKKKVQSTNPNHLHNRMNTYYRETTGNTGDAPNDFIASAIIGVITDDAATATLLGGNPLGAMIGDAINTSDEQKDEKYAGQGGKFGGAGAEGDFSTTNTENEQNRYEPSQEYQSTPEPEPERYSPDPEPSNYESDNTSYESPSSSD